MLLVILAAGAWLTRHAWMGRLHGGPAVAERTEPVWAPLTDSGAERASRAVSSLSRKSGPVFVNLAGAEVAALVMRSLAHQLPAATDSVQAAVIGDQLQVRALVRLRDLGGAAQLGPLASMLGDRERMQLGGTLHVVRPGLAEYRVSDLRLGSLTLPEAMIPKILARLSRGPRREGISPNGLAVPIPRAIADIRVANGRVTLYKSTE